MKPKILIADDDEEIRDLLRYALEGEDYAVIEAHNGEEAVEKSRAEKPDLIILDVMMPKMTGFEACDVIRNDYTTCLTPIIMLTSLSQTKDKVTGIKLGADEFLTKPFEPYELTMRVEGLIRRTKEALAANPLTGLPGNVSVETDIKQKLEHNIPFSAIYIDIDNFKAYNDKYGFERGDGVIRFLATLVRDTVRRLGGKNDFIGHLGGEDFIVLTDPPRAEVICINIIEYFESHIPDHYDEDVKKRGYVWAVDREGNKIKFPLMTLSMGVVQNITKGSFQHYSQVVDQARTLIQQAKAQPGNTFVKN
jgi:diguanylate cyclase (GGDEF)-like protein